MPPGSSEHFPTTAWSIIQKAKDRDSPEYLTAMNRFITSYWRPVFYYVRRRGYPLQRAEDLTQEFFVKCFEEGCIAGADRQTGRFRQYLLGILSNFLSDRSRGREKKQKVFDDRLVCISALLRDDERQFEPPAHETAEQVFMKKWARALLDRALRQLHLWSEEQGRLDWYEIFVAYHFPDPGKRKTTQEALAERFKLTRDQVRYALEKTDEKFIEFFRCEVADQVASADEVDAEIHEIRALL